jgi:hypothetical protein
MGGFKAKEQIYYEVKNWKVLNTGVRVGYLFEDIKEQQKKINPY